VEPSETIRFLKADFNRTALSTKEGVGETSGQTAGSHFRKSSLLLKIGPAEETSFLRSVRILAVRNFTGFQAQPGFQASSEIWS
jgi:hypothetical protein